MKHVILIPLCVLTSILCFACSDDTEQTPTNAINKSTALRSVAVIIENTANPYDNIGQSYRDYMYDYKAGSYSPQSYNDVRTVINSLLSGPSIPANPATQSLLSSCVASPTETTAILLQGSDFSEKAKTTLSDFIGNYERLAKQSFGESYAEIVLTEGNVASSSVLSPEEKRVIFSVTAMTRYSLYHSCCEDTDWEKSVGHIVAAMAGALESNSQALKYSLITKIAGLERIQF